jgi:hypothetical protein
MSNNFVVIPLYNTEVGGNIMNTIWKLNSNQEEEKIDRFDPIFINKIFCILHKYHNYRKHFTLCKIPVELISRCTIAMQNKSSEYIYIIPENDDFSQDGPIYINYTELWKGILINEKLVIKSNYTSNIDKNNNTFHKVLYNSPAIIPDTTANLDCNKLIV